MGGRGGADLQTGDRTRFQDRLPQNVTSDTTQTSAAPNRRSVLLTLLSSLALCVGILIAAKTKHI